MQSRISDGNNYRVHVFKSPTMFALSNNLNSPYKDVLRFKLTFSFLLLYTGYKNEISGDKPNFQIKVIYEAQKLHSIQFFIHPRPVH